MKSAPGFFRTLCVSSGLAAPQSEYRFHPSRKWRFDFAWPEQRIALEVDGGIWVRGRHSRGSGQVKDMEKFNAAAALGWRVLKVQPKELMRAQTLDMVRQAMGQECTRLEVGRAE